MVDKPDTEVPSVLHAMPRSLGVGTGSMGRGIGMEHGGHKGMRGGQAGQGMDFWRSPSVTWAPVVGNALAAFSSIFSGDMEMEKNKRGCLKEEV